MSTILTREQLVRDIALLRRAHHRQPHDEDLVAVRADLERAAGPTLGRAAAARLLGLSQTALDRWIASGDVPIVLTRAGRREVPIPALVDLLDSLDAQRHAIAERHPLAAVLRARRARGAEPTHRIGAARATADDGHRRAELRGLAYHRAVAEILDEATVADALVRIRRWRAEGRMHPRYAADWEALLRGPRAQLTRVLRTDGERAAALRQSSPFAGVLDEHERRRALGP